MSASVAVPVVQFSPARVGRPEPPGFRCPAPGRQACGRARRVAWVLALAAAASPGAGAAPTVQTLHLADLPAQELVRPGRATLLTPDIGAINTVAPTAQGTVWLGGDEGLRHYDGVRLGAPVQMTDRSGAGAEPVRGVSFLWARGDWLYIGAGATLLAWQPGNPAFKQAMEGGQGWASWVRQEGERANAWTAHWCAIGANQVLRLRTLGGEISTVEVSTGRLQVLPVSAEGRVMTASLVCSGRVGFWLERHGDRVRLNRLDTADGMLRRQWLPSDAESVAVQDEDRVWVGTRLGVLSVDTARGTHQLQRLAMPAARGQPARSEPGQRPWQVFATDDGYYTVRQDGSRFHRVRAGQIVESLDANWLTAPTAITRKVLNGVVTLGQGTGRRVWLLRGDWLQLLNTGLESPATAFTFAPSAADHFQPDVHAVCELPGHGAVLRFASGWMGWMAAGESDQLRVLPWRGWRQPLACDPEGVAWFLDGDAGRPDTRLVRLRGLPGGALQAESWPAPKHFNDTSYRTLVPLGAGQIVTVSRGAGYHWHDVTQAWTPLALRWPALGGRLRLRPLPEGDGGARRQLLLAEGRQISLVTLGPEPEAEQRRLLSSPWREGDWPRHVVEALWLSRDELLLVDIDGSMYQWRMLADGRLERDGHWATQAVFGHRRAYCAVQQDPHHVVVATSQGLVSLDLRERTSQVLGPSAGVWWSDFNWDACGTGSARWFGGPDGWVRLDAPRPVASTGMPQAALHALTVGRSSQALPQGEQRVVLREQDALLRLEAAAVGQLLPPGARLHYRLVGVDPEWRRAEPSDAMVYTTLAAGHYELQFGFGDEAGPTKVSTVVIEVRAPWYKQRWVQLSVAALMLLLFLGWLHDKRLQLRRLASSDRQLKLALEASSSALYDDGSGQVVRTAAPWLGYAAPDFPTTWPAFDRLLHPDDLENYRQARARTLSGEAPGIRAEYRLRHRAGHWVWVQDVGQSLARPGAQGQRRLVGAIHPIDHIKSIEEDLRLLATADALTGLPNRRECNRLIEEAIQQASQGHRSVALLFLDVDQFKTLNDSHGHAFGDEVLRQCARSLQALLPGQAWVARLGGDEFVVLWPGAGAEQAQALARRLCEGLRGIRQVAGTPVRLTVSVGVALCPQHARDRCGLLQYADAAMYAAKAAGRDGVALFDVREAPKIAERALVEAALAEALERREFELVYQPRVRMDSGQCEGVEALLRWRNERFAHVPLPRVIDILESSGLIESVGAWVLDTACSHHQILSRARGRPLQMAVNVSVRQLQRQDFAESVVSVLARHGMAGAHLEVEVTETVFAGAYADLLEQLNRVRQAGMGVAVDDFGTGYSALSYLRELPVSTLKIDKTFVRDLAGDERSAKLCQAIVGMGRALSLELVAEGVETALQRDRLLAMGCVQAQGYLFCRPLPLPEVLAWLQAHADQPAEVPRLAPA